jgi:hypothetical protein
MKIKIVITDTTQDLVFIHTLKGVEISITVKHSDSDQKYLRKDLQLYRIEKPYPFTVISIPADLITGKQK